jgi:hypothetical protein
MFTQSRDAAVMSITLRAFRGWFTGDDCIECAATALNGAMQHNCPEPARDAAAEKLNPGPKPGVQLIVDLPGSDGAYGIMTGPNR